MKNKLALSILVSILVIASISAVSANSGSIKTTRSDCVTPQNENQYNIGELVYIKGADFAAGTYNWNITGQPGGASCDPTIVVASGSFNVNSSGAFCFYAYTVANNDCGVYSVDFNKKNDNYHVSAVLIPEFSLVVASLTLASAIGIFFFVRRK